MSSSKHQQKGVALLIVLLIVAIVSVLATEMGTRLQLQIKRASNIKENNQAYWYAMGAEQFAQKSLLELYKTDGNVIHSAQPWNQEYTFPIEGGGIQAQLVDLQSCFNLNALGFSNKRATLVNSPAPLTPDSPSPTVGSPQAKGELSQRLDAFESLLNKIDVGIPTYNIEILRDSLADWLDDDSRARQLGAEDSEYESRQFPYMAANSLMVHKSEIRLVNGIEVKWLDKVLSLVCVIPNNPLLKINVNTVSEENASIIAAMTGLDLNQAQSVIASKGNNGFEKIGDFLNTPEIQALSLTNEQKAWFDVTTSHFILHTKARFNNATFAMQTVFEIDAAKKIKVIRREFSGF